MTARTKVPASACPGCERLVRSFLTPHLAGRRGASRSSAIIVIIVILVVVLSSFYFTASSGTTKSSLLVNVTPPGYPAAGSQWAIQVWQPDTSGHLVGSKNATVMVESGSTTYQIPADSNGQASFTYSSSLGKNVTIVASEPGYVSASYDPVAVFIPSDAAWQVIGAFWGSSVLSSGVLIKFRKKLWVRGSSVASNLAYAAGIGVSVVVILTLIVGVPLTFSWVAQWGNGTAYGFNDLIAFGLYYNPHLLYLLFILVGGTVSLGVIGYFRHDDSSKSSNSNTATGKP